MAVLVTGGACYTGSQMVHELVDASANDRIHRFSLGYQSIEFTHCRRRRSTNYTGLPGLEGTGLSSPNVQRARYVNQRLRRAAIRIARHLTTCRFCRRIAITPDRGLRPPSYPSCSTQKERPPRGGLSKIQYDALVKRPREQRTPSASCASRAAP